MQKSDWRKEVLNEVGKFGAAMSALNTLGKTIGAAGNVVGGALAGAGSAARTVQKVGKAISGREKTASQKRIIKTGGIKAARDVDGDGKLEMKRRGGEYQESLLFQTENNKVKRIYICQKNTYFMI